MGMAPWGDVQETPPPVDEILDINVASRVLSQGGVPPDFKASSRLRYIHKRLAETDLYFVANPEPREVEALCTFRVSGKRPELWWPDTGRTQSAATYDMQQDCTSLPLRLDPSGSVFVVFRQAADVARQAAGGKNWPEFKPVQEIAGPWQVSFDPKWGGPAEPVAFSQLEDWSKRPEQGIRYYSGTATYRIVFPSKVQSPESRTKPKGDSPIFAETMGQSRDKNWDSPRHKNWDSPRHKNRDSPDTKIGTVPESSSISAEWPSWRK